ncbi:Phosphoglycerate mutase [Oleidesulfovibrio alaskensis G20]|jgi:probable phosphoglycerate mutase|uniref:Phosphoglycerate mutase n=1 Tax=Oleidesulfovibrio alaskensis (strain ATCC BAA-1058 / DSM 17464 / G20) TaxID=207559 RepID=Q30VF3_OLEA2|nr:histidine phosphatase family protein [Oleidesulfovibrio alaskensis]ABB40343.2 Phosphoglycerate mutase [Oleidesulfovibrio alaskensis G20]MBG0772849.1 histidine phosphatase family protein [Oleidesulfovibrio alaskensis]
MNGRIALFRHAATSGSGGRAIGRTPVQLSAEGLTQAQGIAAAFGIEQLPDPEEACRCGAQAAQAACGAVHADAPPRPPRIAALYCSPAIRARQTLAPLSGGLESSEVTVLADLDEINLGRWEGMPFAAIEHLYPREYEERGRNMAGFRPPQGESFADVQIRMRKSLALMSAGPFPAVAVTHAGWLRTLLCHLTDTPLDDLFSFYPSYACAAVVELNTGIPRLLGHNLRAHEAAALLGTPVPF